MDAKKFEEKQDIYITSIYLLTKYLLINLKSRKYLLTFQYKNAADTILTKR